MFSGSQISPLLFQQLAKESAKGGNTPSLQNFMNSPGASRLSPNMLLYLNNLTQPSPYTRGLPAVPPGSSTTVPLFPLSNGQNTQTSAPATQDYGKVLGISLQPFYNAALAQQQQSSNAPASTTSTNIQNYLNYLTSPISYPSYQNGLY